MGGEKNWGREGGRRLPKGGETETLRETETEEERGRRDKKGRERDRKRERERESGAGETNLPTLFTTNRLSLPKIDLYA